MGTLPRQSQRLEPAGPGDPIAALVAGAVAGDRLKLARILESSAPAVLRVVRAVLGPDHADVPDVAQESLIALKDALPAYRGESTLGRYARQIALRVALSAQRRTLRRYNLDLRWRAAEEPREVHDDDPAMRGRRTAAFRRLLKELPPAQAESLALRAVLGYSLSQIAAETGAPVNTVRSRLRLAIESLRRRIGRNPALRETLQGEP